MPTKQFQIPLPSREGRGEGQVFRDVSPLTLPSPLRGEGF